MPTVLVTTPTGHIGARVVDRLLDVGANVRAFVRDPDRLDAGVRGRVDARAGDLQDTPTLADAMRGADAAFLLVPPNYAADDWRAFIRGVGRSMAEAARSAGLRRAVFLSSIGAHLPNVGPVSGLGEVEQILRPAVADLAILRPGYFFENAFGALGTVADAGQIFGGFDGDLTFPQVATRDIGDVAARWLLDPSWTGQPLVGVHGPRDLSMHEQAELVSQALGRPVRYTQVPVEAVRQAMAGLGMSPSVAENYGEMISGFAASRYAHPDEPRTAETTTPTEFGSWAREVLRPAFEAAAARAGVREPAHA